jgi:hypothetical protein
VAMARRRTLNPVVRVGGKDGKRTDLSPPSKETNEADQNSGEPQRNRTRAKKWRRKRLGAAAGTEPGSKHEGANCVVNFMRGADMDKSP